MDCLWMAFLWLLFIHIPSFAGHIPYGSSNLHYKMPENPKARISRMMFATMFSIENVHTYTYLYMHTYLYIDIYIYILVCYISIDMIYSVYIYIYTHTSTIHVSICFRFGSPGESASNEILSLRLLAANYTLILTPLASSGVQEENGEPWWIIGWLSSFNADLMLI